MNKFLKEFREFAVRGSVVDMAVGVISLAAGAILPYLPILALQNLENLPKSRLFLFSGGPSCGTEPAYGP